MTEVEGALWRGVAMAEISRETGLKLKDIRAIRDELFAPFSDPEAVKAVANGPLINPLHLNRPRSARKRRVSVPAHQVEMFA